MSGSPWSRCEVIHTTTKCPKCRKTFKLYSTYTKHYASAHYRKSKKAKAKTVKVGKIPVWARRRK